MIHDIYSFHIPEVDPPVYISIFLKIQVSLILLDLAAEGTLLHQNIVTVHQLTWQNVPGDLNLYQHCCENLTP
jgi:hypothetical protein